MLGRTVEELLEGSGAYRPLSNSELTEWMAHTNLKAWEAEEARNRK
jgi:hypothetical protein